MNHQRRNLIQLTAAGLIHIAARPLSSLAAEHYDRNLLIRRAAERGHTDLGWLKGYHTFSFGRYYDQRHMGFRSLRVINDDRIQAGKGFPTHPHRDMEILTYLLSGALQHRDSMGNGSVVRPEDVQMMTAGTGLTHSEYNPSATEGNHLLQIWIRPSLRSLRPSYQQRRIESSERLNRWRLLVSPEQHKEAVMIHQDARVFASVLSANQATEHVVERNRHVWLHVARGQVTVNGTELVAGDAIATSRPVALHTQAKRNSELLLFDLG